ncbi:MAG: transcription initiation protein [Candidatus Dormibacteraeota bacterium]|nr:transcription initiation protein [Candidatus Dormibacteraeota bacterium]MBO0743575.1 transcription initiation protein [Candidatus Dormibacteraeota bacterium]
MQYALLIARDETAPGATSPSDREALTALFAELGPRLVANIRLRPTSAATTVRVYDGDLVIADGPFAETKEQILGMIVVDCEDLDEALEVAAQIPVARLGTIEVRPLWEM